MLHHGSSHILQSNVLQLVNLYSKLDLKTTLRFWDFILEEDEPSSIFFFSIALLIHNRQVKCNKSHKLE